MRYSRLKLGLPLAWKIGGSSLGPVEHLLQCYYIYPRSRLGTSSSPSLQKRSSRSSRAVTVFSPPLYLSVQGAVTCPVSLFRRDKSPIKHYRLLVCGALRERPASVGRSL
jgi:hypothetical protein